MFKISFYVYLLPFQNISITIRNIQFLTRITVASSFDTLKHYLIERTGYNVQFMRYATQLIFDVIQSMTDVVVCERTQISESFLQAEISQNY